MSKDITEFCTLFIRGQPEYKEEIEWLINGIIPNRGIGLILGASGAGKSLLAAHLMASLATGRPFAASSQEQFSSGDVIPENFGLPATQAASLCYLGEGFSGFSGRLKAIEESLSQEEKDNLPLAYASPLEEKHLPIMELRKNRKRLNSVEQIDGIEKELSLLRSYYEECGFSLRLVIIDTLVSSFNINQENDNSEMQRVVDFLSELSARLDCFVFVIAHPPKSKKADTNYSRGAGTLRDSSEVVIKVTKKGGSHSRTATIVKCRDGACEGMEFRFSLETFSGLPALIPRGSNETPKDTYESASSLTKNDRAILQLILSAPEGINKEEIFEAISKDELEQAIKKNKKPVQLSSIKKRVSRTLEKLLCCGEIETFELGHRKVYRVNEEKAEDARMKNWIAITKQFVPLIIAPNEQA